MQVACVFLTDWWRERREEHNTGVVAYADVDGGGFPRVAPNDVELHPRSAQSEGCPPKKIHAWIPQPDLDIMSPKRGKKYISRVFALLLLNKGNAAMLPQPPEKHYKQAMIKCCIYAPKKKHRAGGWANEPYLHSGFRRSRANPFINSLFFALLFHFRSFLVFQSSTLKNLNDPISYVAKFDTSNKCRYWCSLYFFFASWVKQVNRLEEKNWKKYNISIFHMKIIDHFLRWISSPFK